MQKQTDQRVQAAQDFAIEAARLVANTRCQNVVVLDVRLKDANGLELLPLIKKRWPDTEVIMLTGHGDVDLAIESLKLEATDFVTKPINDDVLEIADEADTPEASLDRSNTSAILRACVAKLSPAHREIINLVYYHEKSVEEAGAIIGIPQSTVKTRMFYARKQLAELLKGAGVDSLAA